MTKNLNEIVQRPDEEFRFTLEPINSAFGISADTLKAIAQSYGITPERIIIRALTQLAKVEIPDLDLDEPLLSDTQLEALRIRRLWIDGDRENKRYRPSLLEQFKEHLRVHGEPDENPEEPRPRTGEHP